MGKDFRIGLVLGLMLAIGALIWVATRPSLTPEARMRQALHARPEDFGLRIADRGLPEMPPADPPSEDVLPVAQAPQQSAPTPQDAMPKGDDATPAANTGPNPQSSALPDLTIYEQDEPIKTTRFHIVRRGESLSAIARQYYNAPNDWRKILAANPSIKDANRIAPGTKLIIPD